MSSTEEDKGGTYRTKTIQTEQPKMRMSVFKIGIQDMTMDNLDALTAVMNEWQDSVAEYIETEAKKLGVSNGVAADIVYLRGRSRWTQEKEDHLISLAKAGKPLPNVLTGEF